MSLIDLAVCTAVMAISLLGHAASVIWHQRAATEIRERSLAEITLQRFVERMREDTDWPGLYGRLAQRSAESASDLDRSSSGPDDTLAMHPAAVYYGDFEPPQSLGTVAFLVQVPLTAGADGDGLYESAASPRYGLPADLDGDGFVRSTVRATAYHALPVVVHLRWQHGADATREIVSSTWLRGGW